MDKPIKESFKLESFLKDLKSKLENDGNDLNETPILFKWRYEDEEEYLYSLMIQKTEGTGLIDFIDEDEMYDENAYDDTLWPSDDDTIH